MITRVQVQNFKSLRHVPLTLGQRNALVGPNMSGKSNILDIFRFLAIMVVPTPGAHGLENAFTQLGGFGEAIWKGDETNVISFSLEGDIPLDDPSEPPAEWKYDLSVLGDPRGWIQVQDEALTLRLSGRNFALIEKDDQGQRLLKNSDGRVLSHISFGSRAALEFELPDWQGNRIRQFISSWRFYRLVPGLMKQANAVTATTFLTSTGDNLSAWLMMLQTRYPESFAQINSVARDVFTDFDSLFTWPTQQATVFIASREKHLKRPVSIWHMSDGELAFIALLSLIFCPPELGGGLYCIEEPENNLHPRLLEVLVELTKQVQDDLGRSRSAQILLTTHSPHLVDKLELEELLVVEKRQGATICTRPSEKHSLRELLAREDVGLGDLYYSGALGSA